ncbi:GDSL-like lipase/acylhydrolase family protein [Saccharothrix variisporea]|uniref:GDSL-like lipase/acylhydrolase family protein n=1 Tax=Saccharothrix variisporea TaxID=543527 RepID=A0A495XMT2_9PSEU|nr:GDSL-like lipase/acylhydrolase family protein [Saccharothrix variisporea]
MLRRGVLLVVAAFVVGCTASPPETPPSTTTSAPEAERVYVSLGDSYATGYRPADAGVPAGSGRGFAHLVAERSGLRLVDLACSGATSAQLRSGAGCAPANRGLDAPDPNGSQLDAAVRELRAHKGRVGLVTVVIGGNDLAPCARAQGTQVQEALACASRAVADVRANLAATLPVVREAAGDAPIVGLTYPDVFLGAWVSPAFPDGQGLARLSVSLFRDVFNPALKSEYEKAGAVFVDVTAATGGYGPLTETTQDAAHGPIPTPVAKVCTLTHFCRLADVHPTPAGHEVIADAVLAAVPR